MKSWQQSKTVWLGIVTLFTGLEPAITAFYNTGDFTSPALMNLGIGVLIIVLRFFTKTAVK